MLNLLFTLCQQQHISQADYYFAKLIADKQQGLGYSDTQQQLAILLAALCQHSLSQGNTCLFLDQDLAHHYFGLRSVKDEHHVDYIAQIEQKIDHLPLSQWAEVLQDHVAFTINPTEKVAPLVLQHNALYFYRTWQDEYRLADYIKSAVKNTADLDTAKIKQSLQRYFGDVGANTNWQKIAVAVALRQSFCVISGGPGTGKTYTVARLLAVLQQLHQGQLKIGLAAPTGKAAARLSESISAEFNPKVPTEETLKLQCLLKQDGLFEKMPTSAQTLHSLLGVRPFTEQTKYHAQQPLPYDVLIIDEASMIDLSLMNKLRSALAPHCKLILLGDKDQLSSVEAGAILGELGEFLGLYFDSQRQKNIACYDQDFTDYLTEVTGEKLVVSETPLSPISRCLCYLPDSRRFDEHSGIGHLATAVNNIAPTCGEKSWALFQQNAMADQLHVVEFSSSIEMDEKAFMQDCVRPVVQSAVQNYRDYLAYLQQHSSPLENSDYQVLFEKFNAVRFLTALRGGELGVEKLNQRIAYALQQAGLVSFKNERDWYLGKPIMITQNDRNVNLANGDIGIYVGNNQVCFDSLDKQGKYRLISRHRIPVQYEPAYVMTVHKSQGSEFNHTLLVLPPNNTPVLSKELIYTAITRAKKEFTVFCRKAVWQAAVQRKSKRQSGLKFALDQ
ncbi:exodeoxyribonuclease V subunit alpha [Lonepinella sp. BR2357]|uniref:exodeoxyribonuclease V subunit alpha n=1 Tax=Lonepinella sp. BR2357 TaxID=3434549 RepID=UPI003F6E3F39